MPSRIILSGLRSIEECLRQTPDRITKLLIPAGKLSPRIESIKSEAQSKGIVIEQNPKRDQEEPVLAILREFEYSDFDALLSEFKEEGVTAQSTVLALDGITDPQNLGAILRTAAFMGIRAVLLPKDRSVGVNQTVYKIACGGVEHLQICQVTNLVSALAELKAVGFWIVAFSEHAKQSLDEVNADMPKVLVIGSEEKGVRSLVQKNCDFSVKLKAKGNLFSLNASVAAALAMQWATRN